MRSGKVGPCSKLQSGKRLQYIGSLVPYAWKLVDPQAWNEAADLLNFGARRVSARLPCSSFGKPPISVGPQGSSKQSAESAIPRFRHDQEKSPYRVNCR